MARINERGAFNVRERRALDAALEVKGAQINQSPAETLEARWLQLIRDVDDGNSPAAGITYKGGDVTECIRTAGNDTLWIGADWLTSNQGTITNDVFDGTALPIRNCAFVETTDGTFTGAIALLGANSSGAWVEAVADGGLAAGTIWWPICAIVNGSNLQVVCWHVESPSTAPYGTMLDNHVVTINGSFGTYISHVATSTGGTNNFWVEGLLVDTSLTYIYAEEFRPDFDARRTDGNTDAANYGAGGLPVINSHGSVHRVARVANGSLATHANWAYWQGGTTWTTGATARETAELLRDTDGYPLYGDLGVIKIGTAHYLGCTHRLTDTHVNVYKATAPEGPWRKIARVPVPTQGQNFGSDLGVQIGQLTKILPTQVVSVPSGYRVAMISRNMIGDGETIGTQGQNIRRYAPQFVVIPQD